jgi:N6-adenosine-specific RNA methylase IME4
MPMAEIKALPIPADDNAHLYLWTTNAFMREAHEVAEAWGFKPKTIVTWVKTKVADRASVSMRMGYYFRGATEHCLFAVRGKMRLNVRNLPTAFLWPRIGQHSRKPDAFFEMVETATPGPYLELFARRARPGWTVWGNEVDTEPHAAPPPPTKAGSIARCESALPVRSLSYQPSDLALSDET